ncbi:MAG: HYR domain-containing protein, partial [Bacteroidota bacterium]
MQKILLTVFFSLAFLLGLNAQLTFSLVGPPVSCETNDFCVDVDVQDFTQVTGLEFAILWDTSEFDYVSHTFFLPGVPTANVSTTEGYLAFSWFGPFTGLTLPNDSTIIQMCLTRKANAGTVADIELGAQPGQGISISDLNNGILTQNVDFFFNSVQLTITDDEDPSITCPPDVTVFTSTPTGLGPVALSDNCGIRQVTYTLGGVTSGAGFDDVSGSTFVEGMTTVSYLAEDFGGRTDGCTFNVTYNDTTPLNPDILYFDPLIQQDCSAGTITVDFRVINFDSLISMQMGINWDTSIIEYIAHQNLELNPGTDPFNTALTPGGTLGLIWAQTPATSDGLSLADSTVIFRIEFNVKGTLGLPLFTYGNFGPLLFEISRFDNRRLTPSEYEFLPGTIEVSDIDAPIFSNCPTDITLSATPAACGSIYFWTAPTATDNCDTDLDITNNRNPGDFFDVGVDTVVYIVTDDAGLSDTCSFIVTVQDDTDPVVGCPIDLTVSVDPGNCSASVSGLAPTIAANCPTTTSYTITGATTATGSNDASGTVFQVGTSTVTYNVTESSGRMGSCSFTVTVEDNADPIINCPANIAQNADAGQCGAAVTIPAATATDDCGIQSITNDFNNTADASGTYPVGSTTVVWTATDVNGRTATCSMEIVITDATPPTVNCPADLTVDITSGNSSVVNGIDPVVSDACGVASTTYRLSTGATGNNTASGTSFGLGTTTVTYIATDVNGNVDSCQFGVTVRFVSNDILDCPVNVSTTTDAGQCSAVVTGIAPIINIDMADISTITFSLSQMGSSIGNGNDDASGTAFPNGTTTVEYIANDRFGNADTCTFTVSVTDDELPTWSNCPADVTVNADASCMGMATWAAPLASDNCGVVRIDSSNASGSSFGLGTSIITYVAFDAADNSATCTFRVTVEDNTPPTFDNCGANNLNLTYLPDCRAIATFDAITGTDNCSSAMVTCTHNPGDTLGEGTTRVVCLIVDMAGNTDRCEFDIEVRDTTPPIAVSCPPSVVVGVDEGRCSASVSWQLPVFSDNCSTPVLSSSHPSGFDFPVGNTTVTYTATDDSGNTATCTFAVTVNDDEPPVLVCDSVVVRIDGTVISDPGNIVLDATPDDNCQGVKVAYREPIGMDNCQGNVVATQTSSGPGNGDTFPEGETRIVYQVSDAAGNDAECTILVTVLPLSMIEV